MIGFFRKSLLRKMLVFIGGSTVLLFVLIFGFLYWRVRIDTERNAVKLMEELAGNFAGEMRLEIEEPLAVAKTLGDALGGLWNSNIRDRYAYNALLKGVLEEHPSYLGVWTLWEPNALDAKDDAFKNAPEHDATGRFIPYWYRSDGSVGYDILVDYEDYYGASRTRESVVEPFPYEIEGKTVLLTTITSPIFSPQGAFLGVAGVDIALTTFGESIKSVQPYEGSRAFLFANQGTLVAATDEKMMRTIEKGTTLTLDDLPGTEKKGTWKDSLRQGSFFSAALDSGEGMEEKSLLVMAPLRLGNTETPWGLMIFSPLREVLAEARKLGMIMLLSGVGGILLLLLILAWNARRIVRPIRYLAEEYFPRLGRLNFATHQQDQWLLAYEDEIGKMVSSSRDMRGEVGHMVRLVQEKTRDFAGSAESLSALSEQGMAVMQEVRGQVEQVSRLSESNAAALEQTNAGVEEVSSSASSSAQAASEGAEAAGQTRERSAQALEAMGAVAAKIGQVGDTSRGVTESMKALHASVEQIAGFVNTITGIADQTNLLALNAAIEAARAGEAGRGFAVVAEEVRKLAEESNKAAREVERIISSLQEGAKKAVTDMDRTDTVIAETVQLYRTTQDGLGEALEGMRLVDEAIQNIAASAQEQAASSQEMASSVDSVTKATVEVVGSMENIRGATEETSRSSESVAEEAGRMNKGIQELRDLLETFVVDQERSSETLKALKGRNA